MRKPHRIALTIMGTLLVSGCTREPDVLRNTYRSKQDCVADYSEHQCTEDRYYHGGVYGGGHWYGPTYRRGDTHFSPDNAGPGRDPARPLATETVRRGGFGTIGRSLSRGS